MRDKMGQRLLTGFREMDFIPSPQGATLFA